MTNAEKYLKDEQALMELPSKLRDYIDAQQLGYVTAIMITDFFVAEAKPTLTEDERVILRNIPINFMLYRNSVGGLELRDKDKISHYEFYMYDRLFQFIKKRRRIRD